MALRVLDSSAMLALIQQEPGHDRVLAKSEQHCASAVNMAEVRTRLFDKGLKEAEVELLVLSIKVAVKAFSEDHARLSALLRNATRGKGLSLGDRACLALAQSLGAIAITADRAWAEVALPIEVSLIR